MARSVIVVGPKGCGKTKNKDAIAQAFGLEKIIDNWQPSEPAPNDGTLMLTTQWPDVVSMFVQTIDFEEAMSRVK